MRRVDPNKAPMSARELLEATIAGRERALERALGTSLEPACREEVRLLRGRLAAMAEESAP